jgi:hypothetical protein
MKNKNTIYLVLGIGAGIVAYYLFCKNKAKKIQLNGSITDEDAETPSTGGGGGGFIGGGGLLTPMPTVTPTKLPILTDEVFPTKPAIFIKEPIIETIETATIKPVTSNTTRIKGDVSTVQLTPLIQPTSPTSPSLVDSAVVSEPIRTVSSTLTPIESTATKSSFDGFGQDCFEVGDCLNDL